MSDNQPAPHPEVSVWNNTYGEKRLAVGCQADLTPDEAVALGYALFEHGLYLKGKMKPQRTGEEK